MNKRADKKVASGLFGEPDITEANLRPKKLIRIAVSGDVFVTETELKIIDSPEFQRLRGVRQLGAAHLVYPTALHTRFDHALGTLAMANRMIQAIRTNRHNKSDERQIDFGQEALIRIYALLHDITHVPFGHTLEDELEIFVRHDKNAQRIKTLLGPKSTIGQLLVSQHGQSFYRRFLDVYLWDDKLDRSEMSNDRGAGAVNVKLRSEVLESEAQTASELAPDDVFINDIVSNTVCADLLDYINRDNYFCNLGESLEYRFLNFLYLSKDDWGRRRVFVRLWTRDEKLRRDTLTDLARLLEARYMVAERVYYHRAKIISGTMIGRAVYEAKMAGELTERELLTLYDDDVVRRTCDSKKSVVARNLGNAVRNRTLYKRVHSITKSEIAALQSRTGSEDIYDSVQGKVRDASTRSQLEDRWAEMVGLNAGEVLIYVPRRDMNAKAARTRVKWSGRSSHLEDIDDPIVKPRLELIKRAHEELWAVQIFAVRRWKNGAGEQQDLTQEHEGFLKELAEIELLLPSGSNAELGDTVESGLGMLHKERRERSLILMRQLVRRRLKVKYQSFNADSTELDNQIHRCAENLLAVAYQSTDETNWSATMDKILEKEFGSLRSRSH